MDRRNKDTRGMDSVPKKPHKFDKSNLRQIIYDSPRQFAVGFNLAREVHVDGQFSRVLTYGEGGSAFPFALADIIVRDILKKRWKIPPQFAQNHQYSLEPEAWDNALNVFCSYSGNTEEVLSTLQRAHDAGLPAVGLASGAKLEEFCVKAGIPFAKLPLPTENFQPRMGTGYQLAAFLQILTNHGFIPDVGEEITKQAQDFEGKMLKHEQRGKDLAAKISGRIPQIWASERYRELARVWTIKFKEHAKQASGWDYFPELNHNSMIGFTHGAGHFFTIMLRDPDDDPENLARYGATQQMLEPLGMKFETIDLEGDSAFEKVFNSVYLADFVAYHLAAINKEDPTPVPMVEEFKAVLKGGS